MVGDKKQFEYPDFRVLGYLGDCYSHRDGYLETPRPDYTFELERPIIQPIRAKVVDTKQKVRLGKSSREKPRRHDFLFMLME